MNKIIVAGIGTGVGKTLVSAILMKILQADYWKPIYCGDENTSDNNTIRQLVDADVHTIHPTAYALKAPLSPHHAAYLENISIDLTTIIPPRTSKTLIIESVGGVLVPLKTNIVTLDLFQSWQAEWVLVSKNYLGSINHTLLTIEALKNRGVSILGIIFNGELNPQSEISILQISGLRFLGRILPEISPTSNTIQKYAHTWQKQFQSLRTSSI